MTKLSEKPAWAAALVRIVLPVGLTVVLCVLAIFSLALPAQRENLMAGKQEMLEELTNTASGLLEGYERRVQSGELSLEEAQSQAVATIRELRYGEDDKDYFWINDLHPRMVMHPYLPALEGQDVTSYPDRNGKLLFLEFIEVVQRHGAGFVDYQWQWQDDPEHVAPKLSYVRGFEPWGWVIGTGIYLEDVEAEITEITHRLTRALAAIVLGILLLSSWIIWQATKTERERVRAEEALRDREERLSITLDSIGDGVIATDHRGGIVGLNPVAEELTGWSERDAVGRPLPEVFRAVSSETREPVENPVDKVLRAGEVVALTHGSLLLTREGDEKQIADSGAPIRDRGGDIVGVVLVFRDVSEECAMQEQLRQSARMNAIGQLAGGIAHDFNNILTGIIGHAELLQMELADDPEGKMLADQIVRASLRASDLTTQLLAFSRKGKLQTICVDLHEIVTEVVRLLTRAIDRNIAIVKELEAAPATVMGDPTQLQNAVLNLAVNARDAMPDGGKLTFSTRIVALDNEDCAGHSASVEPGEFLELSVIDTGIGIPEPNLRKIFEPFFTTKALGKGTGLGLAGVWGCALNHRGVVEVKSRRGTGTTFRLLLPLSRAKSRRPFLDVRREHIRGTGSILLVDDEESVRHAAGQALRKLGYEVTTAVDGANGLETFAEARGRFDLVILDMIMPQMGGPEAFRKMRELHPGTPILLSTGYSESDTGTILIREGAAGLLQKPYEIDTLSIEVARHISSRPKDPAEVAHRPT